MEVSTFDVGRKIYSGECRHCGSKLQTQFETQIAIYLEDANKPQVFIFPEIFICLNCGRPEFAREFRVGNGELSLLSGRNAAGA